MQSTRFDSTAVIGKRLIKKFALGCTSFMLVLCITLNPGCGGDFLGLEDYQRDFLFGIGGLALALVAPSGGEVGPAGPQGEQGSQGEPGPQGPAGEGEPGLPGPQGEPGADGQNCWDLNGDGMADVDTEDVNGDGVVDVSDCQGADGEDGLDGLDGFDGEDGIDGEDGLDGADGEDGADGAPGPTLFDTYIDDFFTVEGGSYGSLNLDPGDGLPIVPIREPALGECQPNPESVSVIGYRMAVGERYHGGPVTMRLFVWREGPEPDNCFVFRLDAFRARHGTGVSQYGAPRFIRPDVPALPEAELEAGILLVIDLPLNSANGLGFPDDLAISDLLAFELNSLGDWQDGACYTLLGADFFESDGGETIENAAVFENEAGIDCEFCQDCCTDDEDCECGEECVDGMCVVLGEDCDEDGTPDDCEEFVCQGEDPQQAQSNVGNGEIGGTVFLSGDDADDSNHCHGTLCAGLWPDLLEFAVDNSLTGPGGDGLICAIGVNSSAALVALQGEDGTGGWNNTGDVDHPGPDADIEHIRLNGEIETFDLSACTVLYIPSGSTQTPGGITPSQLAALNTREDDILNYINVQGGALIALTEAEMPGAYGWLPLEIPTADEEHFMATVTDEMQELFPDITDEDVSRPPGDSAPRYHTVFTGPGPAGYGGLEALIRENDADESDGLALMLGGFQVIIDGRLTLTPETATNFLPQDDTHTVTATLIEADAPFDPISGATIEFMVESGPNMDVVGTCSVNADCTTDANGQVSFTYTSNGTPSLVPDVIRARWDIGDDQDAAEKLWLPCHCEDAAPGIGACCDGETCSITSEAACVGGGGEYNGDNSDCDPNPCIEVPAEGACCDGETCSVTTGAACVDGGGEYGGDDTVCDPNPCVEEPAEGACCDGETCSVTTEVACVDGGGAYAGDDTVCDPNPCVEEPAEGACCDGETCSVSTEAACIDGGGKYEGDDSVCDPSPCGEAESDCCIPHATPGCDDEVCEALVCAQDPFCCNPVANWDILCVNQAVDLCGDLCEAPLGPVNDDCEDSIEIFDGETEFDTTEASTDGEAHSDELCQFDGQTYNDIWYDYLATCSGDLTVTTCEDLGGTADYDSDIVVYDGCDICLPGDELVLGCNDDDPVNLCGIDDFQSTIVVPVVDGNCYKIRIGGFKGGDSGTGTALVTCEP